MFECFHDALLLGAGGATAYHGPTTQALPYLARLGFNLPVGETPADFMLNVTCGKVSPDGLGELIPEGFAPSDLIEAWQRAAGLPPMTRSSGSRPSGGHGHSYGVGPMRGLGWRERTLLVAAEQPW